MKKLLLVLLLPMLCVSCGKQKKYITKTDIIVDKYTRQELDNFSTWFWSIPQTKTVYYFRLEHYAEKSVSSDDYSKYKIGDTYTWTEVVYE